jgi:CRP-like cAMP-binding protein
MSRTESALRPHLAACLRALSPVDDPAIDALAALASTRSFDAHEWLLRGGERAEWCFLITKGLVRELYIGETGDEHTRSFVADGQVTGSLLDLLAGRPSVTWIQALEPTRTIVWRYAAFEALCDRFPALHLVARRHAEALYVKKTRREHDMLALSSTERYRRWSESHPGLDARVLRKHLASYLGVTPEHLSRLRRTR